MIDKIIFVSVSFVSFELKGKPFLITCFHVSLKMFFFLHTNKYYFIFIRKIMKSDVNLNWIIKTTGHIFKFRIV